jgi:predicted ATPase/DNA-binding SARP family transcriptional activator
MLGPFEVRTDDGVVADVPGDRLRALLIVLALEPRRVVQKATLVDWIWGEYPPADATNALQRLVSRLRKVIPDGTIEGQAGGYRLTVDPDDVDAVRFERLVGQGREADDEQRAARLREAVGLWRGAAMQDLELPDSTAFDAAVTRLERLRLNAMEDRFDAELDAGNGAELVEELTDLVAAHPMRERFTAALMRALAAAGRANEALQVYERAREALADELGVDPSPEVSALHVKLLRGELAPPKPKAKEVRRTNLRAELTSFVGRDDDIAVTRELIAEHRLTTLIGPGGAGKTRLATETARSLLGEFPDGAWLIELAPIGPDGDVAQAALTGLGLRDALLGEASGAEPTERLIAAIRERETLLVLDNCEHVIEAAAVFADRLLGECRNLRILATSREPLGITGEALWLVDPLALPDADADPGEIEASPAVRLLRDRAGAVRKDLAVDAPALARVCRALDGMPLAIELAAAKLRTMTLDQLANRLDDRFRLLTAGSRTALPRHKTLRAVIDWSWELLTGAERTVLRRLSVFSGGASPEAAEQVCAAIVSDAGTTAGNGTVEGKAVGSAAGAGTVAAGAGTAGIAAADGVGTATVEPEDVLELLTALTEKSLLVADGEGAPRYRMLGTIKEYAAQRLAEAGETEAARRAHLAYFTELAETADPHLRRAEQVEWFATLDAEHDNISAAMRGALAAENAPAAMRLAASAGWYWWLGGRKAEGSELITAATKLSGDVADEVRAMVYTHVVTLLTAGRSDERQAGEWIREAYRCSQSGKDRYPLLALIAPLEHMLREPGTVLSAWEPLLEDGDAWVRAMARLQLGKMRVLLGHEGPEAEAYLEAALAEFRALGERFGISFAQSELADRFAGRGEFAAACEHYEQAIEAVTEIGAVDDVIRMRSWQARLYRLLGDEEASAASLAAAERSAEGVTWPDALVELALAKAELARWSGDAEEARRQVDIVLSTLGEEAKLPNVRATTHNLLGYLADDLAEAREHFALACAAASEAGIAPMIAQVLVGIADLALRRERYEEAARLLAASAAVRGLPDRTQPDVARIERETLSRLGEAGYAEATREGAQADWNDLVAAVLAD